jgi:hypothetical protein
LLAALLLLGFLPGRRVVLGMPPALGQEMKPWVAKAAPTPAVAHSPTLSTL